MTGKQQKRLAAVIATAVVMIGIPAFGQVKPADQIGTELRPGGQHRPGGNSHDMSLEIVNPGQAPEPAAPPPPSPPQTNAPHSDITVYFDFNSATIKRESIAQLHELAAALNSAGLAKYHFAIIGYTDSKGSDAQNLRLSVLRAAAVFEVLTTKFGIAPSRLYAQGLGKSGSGGSDAAKDRRVEIVNLF